MLCVPVFIIYIRQLSSFRVPRLTVVTCHVQYTFLSLCQFVSREKGQDTKILEVRLTTIHLSLIFGLL